MKTIKDAVIELDGKLPAEKEIVNGWTLYNGRLIYLKTIEQPIVFAPEEFEANAKRMGYINGYEWGKEYPTNGKRPDLEDDVVVQCKGKRGVWFSDDAVVEWSWDYATEFRITDPRYKPVDEALESGSEWKELMERALKKHADYVQENVVNPWMEKSMFNSDNSWHDRGELPPVGAECEIGWNGSESHEWYKGAVAYRSEKYTVIIYDDGKESCYRKGELTDIKFRPIKSHREKVIEAALDVSIENDGLYGPLVPHINQILERLFRANMLVLPQKSGDTED